MLDDSLIGWIWNIPKPTNKPKDLPFSPEHLVLSGRKLSKLLTNFETGFE